MVTLRPAAPDDADALWSILEPIVQAGETFALPRDMSRREVLAWWQAPGNEVFVAEVQGSVLGTYFIHPNQLGPGSHVANCGYATAPPASGRGIARAMCAHSLEHGRARGYRSMQFNIVVSTNTPAVHLWTSMGFRTLCRVPGAFHHPVHGLVDTLVMFREL
ncbi:MAG TPA: GNAT family N-acetyltransferase [Myxococcaceae bacterium]|nr:GNAT family N-acetyltransferase [Myxococcaceae bacterium]